MQMQRAEPDFAETAPAIQLHELQQGASNWRAIFGGLMAVLVVLVWIAFVERVGHERELALETVAQRDTNLATAVDLYAVRVFRNARAVQQLLGTMYARGTDETRMAEAVRDRLKANDVFVDLALCLPDGRVLSGAAPVSLLAPADCQALATAPVPGRDINVAPPLTTGGMLLVPLTLPLPAADEAPGPLAVALVSGGSLLGVMGATRLRDATTVVLVGDDGLVRAAWRSDTGAIADPRAAQALAGLRSAGDGAEIDGEPHLVTVRGLPVWGLQVVVATAQRDALAGVDQRRTFYLVACLAITAGILGVYFLLARMQSESTRRARSLSRARTQLQVLNQQLDAQVQERTAQLQQAYRDLESFSYTIAHDVRAPLAAITAYAGELEPVVAASGSAKHVRYLERISVNARQMDGLTRHLLELGKLTSAPLRLERVDAAAIAQEVLARLQELEPDRTLQAEVETDVLVQADPALLRQLLENLLGNAWKFSAGRDPARIVVGRAEGTAAPGWQTLFVSDNGAGFDSGQANGLFQPFRRQHSADQFPGSGIGLATVQRIVTLHGGAVWCEAQPEAGATFFFTLRCPG